MLVFSVICTVKYKVRLLDGSVVAETPEGGLEFYVNEGEMCYKLYILLMKN